MLSLLGGAISIRLQVSARKKTHRVNEFSKTLKSLVVASRARHCINCR